MYLDENVSSTALPNTRVPMRIHYPNRFVVQWSKIQHVNSFRSCGIDTFSNQDHDSYQQNQTLLNLTNFFW